MTVGSYIVALSLCFFFPSDMDYILPTIFGKSKFCMLHLSSVLFPSLTRLISKHRTDLLFGRLIWVGGWVYYIIEDLQLYNTVCELHPLNQKITRVKLSCSSHQLKDVFDSHIKITHPPVVLSSLHPTNLLEHLKSDFRYVVAPPPVDIELFRPGWVRVATIKEVPWKTMII